MCLILLSNILIYLDSHYKTGFYELSFTECGQEIILFICVCIYIFAGIRFPETKGLSFFLAGLACMAFIREFNNFFKNIDFIGGWQIPFYIILLFTLFSAFHFKNSFSSTIKKRYNELAFVYTFCGFIIVTIFSRLFGYKKLWKNIFQLEHLEGSFRIAKNAAEEGTELVGYMLILIGGIEYLLNLKKKL